MVVPIQNLAIIMDGNGRWAQKRGLPRNYGHLKGTRVAKKIISYCADLGIKNLVLYAFSTENWCRPQSEVSFLMRILQRYLERETENLIKKDIRFQVIGELHRLNSNLVSMITETEKRTSRCSGLRVIFALSYGSRAEITDACRLIAQKVQEGLIKPQEIDANVINEHLWLPKDCEPDLVIRTSGEQRLSNFLLWQIAYSELYFTPVLWPDFKESHLLEALESYNKRNRRFGGLGDTTKSLPVNL